MAFIVHEGSVSIYLEGGIAPDATGTLLLEIQL